MGSKGDLAHGQKIADFIKRFGVDYVIRIASAHKVPLKALGILKEYENSDVVFITIAGRSNALSGFVDANTAHPVIACPPYGEKFAGMDVFSTIRMPSAVAPMLVLEPEDAALATLKVIAVADKSLRQKIAEYQQSKKDEIDREDKALQK